MNLTKFDALLFTAFAMAVVYDQAEDRVQRMPDLELSAATAIEGDKVTRTIHGYPGGDVSYIFDFYAGKYAEERLNGLVTQPGGQIWITFDDGSERNAALRQKAYDMACDHAWENKNNYFIARYCVDY